MQNTQSGVDSKLYKTIVTIIDKRVKEIKVTRKDFDNLSGEVHELREDFAELKGILQELAQAQKRTEERVEELAQAQKRTEEELRKLVGEHRETRKQLGGLADIVGYGLEDKAYSKLPELLKRDFGITVSGKINRRHVKDNTGNYIEVNILGEAIRNGKKITIVGEGKSQLSKNKVDEFIEKKLDRLEGVYEEIFPVLITYMISEHDVEDYAKERKIVVYYSYDL